MKAGLIYRGEFENVEEQLVTVSLYDNAVQIADDADEEIIELKMAEDALHLLTSDNDEDKWKTVKPLQALLRVIMTTEFNLNILLNGDVEEDRYYLEIEVNDTGRYIFRGHLILDDIEEAFLPEGTVIILTANDKLAAQKDNPLLNAENVNPALEHRIIDFISWVLRKTNLRIRLNVISNLREENGGTGTADHWYRRIFLNAKTFEAEINECVDGYRVLEILFGEDSFISQAKGEWWVMRVDEFDSHLMYVYVFDENGDFVEAQAGTQYTKNIGITEVIKFSQESARVIPERQSKSVKLTFPYENPKEIPCNVDFSRGTGDEPNPADDDETIDYVPECWQFMKEGASGTNADLDALPDAGSFGVLRKKFEYAYEKERYLATETTAGRCYFKSERIAVKEKDKVSIGVDTRFSVNDPVTNMYPLHVRLIADNGDMYDWEYDQYTDVNRWVQVFSATGWFLYPFRLDRTGEDSSEWRNLSGTSEPIPATGYLVIRLVVGTVAPSQLWFSNLTFEHLAFINGSYQKYTNQYNKVSQTPNFSAKRDEEVKISDAPNKLMKGALLYISGYNEIFSGNITFGATSFSIPGYKVGLFSPGQRLRFNSASHTDLDDVVTEVAYVVIGDVTTVTVKNPSFTAGTEAGTIEEPVFSNTGRWYNGAVFPAGVPDDTYLHPFGYIQAFSVWNQLKQYQRKFRATMQGLDSGSVDGEDRCDAPGLFHKYIFTDADGHTNQRYFQLLSFDQNWKTCEWTGVFKEVYNLNTGKIYTDSHEFKYTTR